MGTIQKEAPKAQNGPGSKVQDRAATLRAELEAAEAVIQQERELIRQRDKAMEDHAASVEKHQDDLAHLQTKIVDMREARQKATAKVVEIQAELKRIGG